MYFDSKIKGHRGLPWLDSRTNWEKSSDKYFEELEELLAKIDDIEAGTTFITEFSPEDFSNGYKFVLARIKELRAYLVNEETVSDRSDYIESLNEIYDELSELSFDSTLYDNDFDDWDEKDDWDDEDDEDDEDDWDDDLDEEDYL